VIHRTQAVSTRRCSWRRSGQAAARLPSVKIAIVLDGCPHSWGLAANSIGRKAVPIEHSRSISSSGLQSYEAHGSSTCRWYDIARSYCSRVDDPTSFRRSWKLGGGRMVRGRHAKRKQLHDSRGHRLQLRSYTEVCPQHRVPNMPWKYWRARQVQRVWDCLLDRLDNERQFGNESLLPPQYVLDATQAQLVPTV